MKETIKQNFYEKLEKIREISDTFEKELSEHLDIEAYIEVYVRTVPIGIEVLTRFYDFKTEKTYFCNSYIRDEGNGEIQDSVTYENDNLYYPHWVVAEHTKIMKQVKNVLFEEEIITMTIDLELKVEDALFRIKEIY